MNVQDEYGKKMCIRDSFTVGRDREMDLYLAKHDVLGLSLIHI